MSLQSRIESLKTRHASLEARIADEDQRPRPDSDALVKLKVEKLRREGRDGTAANVELTAAALEHAARRDRAARPAVAAGSCAAGPASRIDGAGAASSGCR